MVIKSPDIDDANAICDYYYRNREHLAPWEPARGEEFFTERFWQDRLSVWKSNQQLGIGAHFIANSYAQPTVVGVCSLTNIIRGPFLACNVGYSVSAESEGQGIAKKLLSHAVDFAFNDLKLNRVMANYLPKNNRSANLLASLGFEREGIARRYLKINGVWEDHVLTALINPNNLQ